MVIALVGVPMSAAASPPTFVRDAARLRTAVDAAPRSVVPAGAGGASVDQLEAAMLAPEDLPPGFAIVDGNTRDRPPQASRFLIRLGQNSVVDLDAEQIYVGLEADASADLVTVVAEGGIDALRTQSNVEDVTVSDRLATPWLAPGAIAYQFTGRGGIRTVFGNLYAWRQGPVVALLMVIINTGEIEQTSEIAARYAQLQRDKLAAALAEGGP